MIVAIGKPGLIFKSNAIVTCLQLACLYPALRYFGIAGVAVVVTLSYTVQFLIYFPALRREMAMTFTSVYRCVHPAILSGCVLAACGFAVDRFLETSWLSLTIKLTVGSGLYLLTYGLVTKWKILMEARQIVSAALLRFSELNG